ncbi:MAG: DinB family protein [Ignavibacteriales bacterium]|nr:MAG: DinB family protein [Ignavibacteriales bacterium]
MHSSLKPLETILVLNTRLIKNAVDEIDDELAEKRISQNTNSIKFLLCHIVDARFFLAGIMGLSEICPFKDIFDKVQTIEEFNQYPPMDSLMNSFELITSKISVQFSKLDNEAISKQLTNKFPIEDRTVLGGITFLLEHESYHIGQIGFIRKYFGLNPIKYS